MNIRIEKELFQWEEGRYVYIETKENEPKISSMQFYNKKSKFAPVAFVEGNRAQIPNSLLKEHFPITVLACFEDEMGNIQVAKRKEFEVLKRTVPEYAYEGDPDEDNDPEIDEDVIYDGGEEK